MRILMRSRAAAAVISLTALLVVWSCGDGDWKIHANIWNTSPTLAAPR
jgi:hypothetical protein